MEGMNDDSASQKLFGTGGSDEPGDEASGAGWRRSALSTRLLPGQETLNSILHILPPLNCIEGTFKSHDGQYKNPDLAALYSGRIFFLQHLNTSNKHEN